jgi:hypothetical protein
MMTLRPEIFKIRISNSGNNSSVYGKQGNRDE